MANGRLLDEFWKNGVRPLRLIVSWKVSAIDTLFGETDADWYLYSQTGLVADLLNDLATGEVETDIG